MDRHIVYSKELTKADTLILKNLQADIQDVAAKPASEGSGMIHGHTGHADGNTATLKFPEPQQLCSSLV